MYNVIKYDTFFDPDLVAIVKKLSISEAFWLDIVNYEYQNEFLSGFDFFGKRILSSDDLINIADIFSKVVDATSSFTVRHSKSVAIASTFLAEKHGYNVEEVKMFYLAGFVT